MASIIDGKAIAQQIRNELKVDITKLEQQGIRPGLAVIIVGENPASQTYVRLKIKACEQLGIQSRAIRLADSVTEEELLMQIEQLNNDEDIDGILVQLPLPDHISEQAVIDTIALEKDVDGFHPNNVGKMVTGDDCLLPCTPHGIIRLIESTGETIEGKHAVVIGRSNIVGKPVAQMLLHQHATVTICHSRTQNLSDITRQADILVVAAGKRGFIGKEHVAPGTVVIDVGTNPTGEGKKLAGDVRFDEVEPIASAITPVPGGVGPMTITMLLYNTVKAANRRV